MLFFTWYSINIWQHHGFLVVFLFFFADLRRFIVVPLSGLSSILHPLVSFAPSIKPLFIHVAWSLPLHYITRAFSQYVSRMTPSSFFRKPALVRLGETHTSKCRPKRETVFSASECRVC